MNFTLYIPGLFGPAARFSEEFIPPAPALEFILGRAQHSAIEDVSYHASLCRLFDLKAPADRDIPVAAITRLIDADDYAAGCWMRADPVHLRADRQGLTLLDARTLNLDMRDALALAAELHELMEQEGWRLEVPQPGRWYVRLGGVPALCTRELDTIVGRDIGQALPTGQEAAHFHALLNEIQMRLHGGEVNRVRESRGLAPVNSLWLWGIGDLPAAVAPRWWKVYSDDISARAFARLAGTPSAPLPSAARDIAAAAAGAAPMLVVFDACKLHVEYQDLQGWYDSVCALDQDWFQPCLEMLQSGDLKCLELVSGHDRFLLTQAGRYRFWRRPSALADHVAGA